MNCIPTDSKYIPLTQQKWCCVPTCVQMIMLRQSIPLISAEKLGHALGLTIPLEDQHLFWKPRIGKKPASGYGTQAGKPQYGPNAVFKKFNIPLKMSWKLIDRFKIFDQFSNYLKEIRDEEDILVCFDWGKLHQKDYSGGHVCLIDKVYSDKKQVRIIDPDPFMPKWQTHPYKTLYESMIVHGKKNGGGFWELTRK